jgi:hypothetical protein
MATVVQRITGLSLSGGNTLVLPSNVTAGNHIAVIGIHSYLACPPSVSDSQSNTYTKHVNGTLPSGGLYFYVWTAPVTSSGACTVTLAMACGNFPIIGAVEVSGLNATTPFGGSNVAANTTNPTYAGSITPTVNGSYLAAIFRNAAAATHTPMAGWTEVADPGSVLFEDVIQTTAATITPEATLSSTVDSTGYTAFFNAAAAFSAIAAISSGYHNRGLR